MFAEFVAEFSSRISLMTLFCESFDDLLVLQNRS